MRVATLLKFGVTNSWYTLPRSLGFMGAWKIPHPRLHRRGRVFISWVSLERRMHAWEREEQWKGGPLAPTKKKNNKKRLLGEVSGIWRDLLCAEVEWIQGKGWLGCERASEWVSEALERSPSWWNRALPEECAHSKSEWVGGDAGGSPWIAPEQRRPTRSQVNTLSAQVTHANVLQHPALLLSLSTSVIRKNPSGAWGSRSCHLSLWGCCESDRQKPWRLTPAQAFPRSPKFHF